MCYHVSMIQPLFVFGDYGVLILRVALGIILVAHGLPKLRDLKSTGEWMGSVGFKPGAFWALVVGLVEAVGGVMIIFGVLTQIVSAFVAIQFVVIFLTVKRKASFEDKEKDLLILAGALLLLVSTSGAYSVDEALGWIFY